MEEEFMSFGSLEVEGARQRSIPFSDPILAPRLKKMGRILPDDELTIFLHESPAQAMVTQAYERPDEEIGGLLLGGNYSDDGRSFVVIEDIIAAQHVLSSSNSLKFTHETWSALTRSLQARGDGSKSIGWYHSHPCSAAFLSEDDNFIHHNFFSQPWQIAVVVSVRDQVLATFQWREDVLVGRCGYYLIKESCHGSEEHSLAKE